MWDSIVVLWGLVKMCNPKAMFFLQHLSPPNSLSTIVEHSEYGSNEVGCGEEIVFCDGM
jgi:hypothetical protein